MELLAEKPLQTEGKNNDKFNLKNYVNALSNIIETTSTPFTISIQGEWGSGKTSFMNYVLNQFSAKEYQTIVINTWDYTQFKDQNISFNILVELVHKIVPEDNKNIIKALRDIITQATFSKMNAVINRYVFNGGNKFDLQKSLKEFDEINDHVGNISETPIEEVKRFRAALQKYISEEDERKRIIFIDDLDRLQPTNVVEILEALQIFLSVENCVFVLAVDYDVIIEGYIQKMSENKANSSYDNQYKATRFFDKIIQLPFNLPAFDDDYAQSFIKDLLESVLRNSNDYQKKHNDSHTGSMIEDLKQSDIDIILEYFKHSVGLNPRQMKRVINTYWLNHLLVPETSMTQNLVADLYLTCMKIEYLELYKLINKYANQHKTITLFFELIEEKSFKEIIEYSHFDHPYFTTDLKLLIDKNSNNPGYLLRMEQYLRYVSGLFIESNTLTDRFHSALHLTQMGGEEIEVDYQENLIARVILNLNDKANDSDIDIIKNILKPVSLYRSISKIHLGSNQDDSFRIFIDFTKPLPKSVQSEIKELIYTSDFKHNLSRVTSHKVLYPV